MDSFQALRYPMWLILALHYTTPIFPFLTVTVHSFSYWNMKTGQPWSLSVLRVAPLITVALKGPLPRALEIPRPGPLGWPLLNCCVASSDFPACLLVLTPPKSLFWSHLFLYYSCLIPHSSWVSWVLQVRCLLSHSPPVSLNTLVSACPIPLPGRSCWLKMLSCQPFTCPIFLGYTSLIKKKKNEPISLELSSLIPDDDLGQYSQDQSILGSLMLCHNYLGSFWKMEIPKFMS